VKRLLLCFSSFDTNLINIYFKPVVYQCFTERNETVLQSFNELNLSPQIMLAISELGYEKPSPIQAQALPILLGEPTDFLGLAATGTGKTAAFAIPLLERIDSSRRGVQALILCPTRELAIQVAGQIDLLGKHLGIHALPIYGGSSFGNQMAGLKRNPAIVVGTPGRIVDHMERGTLTFDELHTIILDEADEMISMGFKDDLEKILNSIPKGMANTWLFSATMSSEVRRVADTYLHEPKQVQVNKTEVLPENVQQIYYVTSEANKPEVLCKLIDAADDFYGIVFCQTKSLVTELTQYLTGRSYRVDCLHGDMDQNARERTVQAFRDRKVSLLICTDVASRGLDVKDITHVINYSIPRELDSYVHRIGRTARSGKAGMAMSLVTPSHRGLIGRIEKMTRRKMGEGKIPSRKEIGEKKISKILTHFQSQEQHARAMELMGENWKYAVAGLKSEEIAARFLMMMFPEVFAGREQLDGAKPARIQPAQTERHENHRGGKSRIVVEPRKDQRSFKQGTSTQPAPWGKEKSYNRSEKRDRSNRWNPNGHPGSHEKPKRKFGWDKHLSRKNVNA
jgi:ATP-dependent RNA helicase DeaD